MEGEAFRLKMILMILILMILKNHIKF